MSLEDFEPDLDPMDCVLLACFREAEQPQEVRDFFNRAGAFELGVGAWLIPIATDAETFREQLNAHFPSLDQGVAVLSLSRFGRPPSVQDWPELLDWWQSAREPGQPDAKKMGKKPDMILDGAWVEVEGIKVLVIPFDFEATAADAEAFAKLTHKLSFPIVGARLRADGVYDFFGTAPYSGILQARNVSELPWGKIHISQ